MTCHLDRQYADGAVSYKCVTRARNPEDRGKMTGGRIKNCFREKQGTRRLRTGLDYVVIKAFCINDAAVRDGKHQGQSFCLDLSDCRSCLGQGIDPCGGRKTRDCAGAAKTRMRRQIFQRLGRDTKSGVCFIRDRIRDRLHWGFIATKQTAPNCIDSAAKRRDPAHACNSQAHAASFWIRMEAFVPPNPNEFDRMMSTFASRDSFATMFRLRSWSAFRKLMFGGTT